MSIDERLERFALAERCFLTMLAACRDSVNPESLAAAAFALADAFLAEREKAPR